MAENVENGKGNGKERSFSLLGSIRHSVLTAMEERKLGSVIRSKQLPIENLKAEIERIVEVELKRLGGRKHRKDEELMFSPEAKKTIEENKKAIAQLEADPLHIAAINQFMGYNLRLVMGIAKNLRLPNTRLEDRFQEGCLGLRKAVEKFNPDLGFRFGTYAVWWIKQYIFRLCQDKDTHVRIPTHVHEAMIFLAKREGELANKLGRKPTDGELVAYMNSKKGMGTRKEVPVNLKTVSGLQNLRRIFAEMYNLPSLHDSVGQGANSRTLLESIPDANTRTPEELAISLDVRRFVRDVAGKVLKKDTRQAKVFFERVLAEDKPTLDVLGVEMDLSRESVRQIEKMAKERVARAIRENEKMNGHS